MYSGRKKTHTYNSPRSSVLDSGKKGKFDDKESGKQEKPSIFNLAEESTQGRE